MRVLLSTLAVLVGLAAGCTKRNENLCCIDEADCNQIGESNVVPCNDGFVCRGNQCIAIACASNTDCDATAPFCDTATGRCEEACATDEQCPGFQGDASLGVCEASTCVECRDNGQCGGGLPACVSNACVECSEDSQCDGPVGACVDNQCIECREDSQCSDPTPACISNQCLECRDNSQCDGNRPICDGNACRACTANSECASGVCTDVGECASEAQISHVAPAGTATAPCTIAEPCSLERALELVASRPFVLLAGGTYVGTAPFVLGENGHLMGDPAAPPTLRNGSAEDTAVVRIAAGADAVLENLRIGEASSTLNGIVGNGILCPDPARLDVRNVELYDNRSARAGAGIYASGCQVKVVDSTFKGNTRGIYIVNAVVDVDRCTFVQNAYGVEFDAGAFEIRNSVVARSSQFGLLISEHVGTVVEFNTIVDNATGVACSEGELDPLPLTNNVVARSSVANLSGPKCNASTSLVLPGIAGLNFVRADLEPYDYHIGPGSSAIDQATGGDTVTMDIDGEPRPAGAARDLGADELQ